jgi:hypothetical protein
LGLPISCVFWQASRFLHAKTARSAASAAQAGIGLPAMSR